jgi:hypothetical protein
MLGVRAAESDENRTDRGTKTMSEESEIKEVRPASRREHEQARLLAMLDA